MTYELGDALLASRSTKSLVVAVLIVRRFFLPFCTACEPLALVGEPCTEWRTWSQWFGVRSIAGASLLQSFAYILLAVSFVGIQASDLTTNMVPAWICGRCVDSRRILRAVVSPHVGKSTRSFKTLSYSAFHTGIPEIKAVSHTHTMLSSTPIPGSLTDVCL